MYVSLTAFKGEKILVSNIQCVVFSIDILTFETPTFQEQFQSTSFLALL